MILIILTIIYFIIKLCNQKIETFDIISGIIETKTGIPMPNIENDANVSISSSLITDNGSNIYRTENIRETLEIKGDSDNYYIISSSYIKNGGDYLASLLKKTPPSSGITLNSPNLFDNDLKYNIKSGYSGSVYNLYNYITILFPYTNITVYNIEITYTSYTLYNKNDFKGIVDMPKTDIHIYTYDDITYTALDSKNFTSNTTTTLKFELNDKVINRYLYIFISPVIKNITLTKILFLVQKKEYTSTLELESDYIVKYNTDNPAEQITIPSTYIAPDIPESQYGSGTSVNIYDKFNSLLQLIPPWAIYDGQDYKTDNGKRIIPEALGRECRNAIISGREPTIETDNKTKDVNIRYLSGKTDTIVRFPEYSLPEYYTICTITKYTNTTESYKRGRIITCANHHNTNWLIGQHGDYTGMFHNNQWKTYWATDLPGDKNIWVVSCVKASYSTVGSMLFNGTERAIAAPGPINNYASSKKDLTINTDNYSQHSDFGLSYVIIWNVVLTDNQLKLVSDTLNDYLKTGKKLPLDDISINIKDGSTREKAARSAMEIKRITCTNNNGVYWILPKNETSIAKAKQIYCIMDDLVFGGGWMMAIKGDKTKNTFHFFSEHWTNNTTLNEEDGNFENFTDAKYDIYNNYKTYDCLAIFDPKDTNGEYTFINKPEYGWIWYQPNFFNGQQISLLDFYKSKPGYPWGNHSYIYTSLNDNLGYVGQRMRDVEWYYGGGQVYVQPKYFDQYYINVTCTARVPLNPKIFSRQDAFKAYGFNVVPLGWAHSVRWGGSFNENLSHRDGVPDSNDVSCGIGLQAHNRSAGDAIGCCQSSTGTNAPMGFKWFIR